MKTIPRPTSPQEAIIICWLWTLGLLSIYLNLKTAAYPLVDAVDLGVSEIIYLEDLEGNSMELCWDRPKTEWPKKPNGDFERSSRPLDLEGLLLML